jgi:hypothetical protein
MSVRIRARHFCSGLSDELSVRNRKDTTIDRDVDICAEARLKLYTRQTLSSSQDNGFDQLFHCRKHLVWSTENRERVRFEASGPIVDAELCRFAEERASTILCVSEPGLLSMYSTDGDLQEHTVKQPVRSLWSTPVGLLVEGFEGIAAQMATHMISGLQPLRTVNGGKLPWVQEGHPYAWEHERILFLDASTPLAVTSDQNITSIRIWCLKTLPEGALGLPTATHLTAPVWSPVETPFPLSAISNGSRIRTPDGNIHSLAFTAFRSGDIGTSSTWAREKVREKDLCSGTRMGWT